MIPGATPEHLASQARIERRAAAILDSHAPADTDWQPGEPLYSRAQYRGYFFNFRPDNTVADVCACPDAATWPTPQARHDLGDGDELAPLTSGGSRG